MRALIAGLVLVVLGCLYASPEAGAALRVSPNTYNVNAGHGQKVLARIENDSGQFTVRGRGTFCFTFSPATGCDPPNVLGFQSVASSNFPSGFVDGFDVNISISALILNKVQVLMQQDASRALFFFVIELVPAAGVDLGNGANVPFFVQVNFRMFGGSSAGKALSITRIKLTSVLPGKPEVRNTIINEENRTLGEFCLEIWYTGSGRVDGSWQLVTNNHPAPEKRDLMTEASLPENERRLQRNFLEVKQIRTYFGPKGYVKLTLPFSAIPTDLRGLMLLFPRFEASRDRLSNVTGGNSLIGNTFVRTGLTMEGTVPTMRVLNAITGEPYQFLTNAKAGIADAGNGQPRRLIVTWTAMTDKRYVVGVDVSTKTSMESAIAPLPSGQVTVPLGRLGSGVTLADLEVKVTVIGLDGKAHPDAQPLLLTGANQATE